MNSQLTAIEEGSTLEIALRDGSTLTVDIEAGEVTALEVRSFYGSLKSFWVRDFFLFGLGLNRGTGRGQVGR